jgi:hypothetical protein
MTDRPAWNALLAPLPDDAVPTRQPVAPPELRERPEGAAIAGWEQIVLHLSDPCKGLRTVLVVVDASGTAISASDGVFYYIDGEPRRVYHELLGGRLEADGRFLGTHWVSIGPDPGEDQPAQLETTPSVPTPQQIAGLLALVDEMLRRQPRRS